MLSPKQILLGILFSGGLALGALAGLNWTTAIFDAAAVPAAYAEECDEHAPPPGVDCPPTPTPTATPTPLGG